MNTFILAIWAVVELSSNFVREKPDYESPLVTQSLMGQVFEVTETRGYWKKISDPCFYTGWATDLGLVLMDDKQKDAYIASPKYICVSEYCRIYAEPDDSADRICDLTMGDLVLKTRADREGWQKVMLPSGRTGWVHDKDVEDFRTWASEAGPTEENVVATARKFLGTPYMWGGNSIKYFDCSGLSYFTYRMLGVLLPRDAKEQIKTGVEVKADVRSMRPGDLVFFGRKATADSPARVSHVAIYIGGGKIIHSSHMVRINSLVKGEPGYYEREIVGVRRIIGHTDDGKGIRRIINDPSYFKQ